LRKFLILISSILVGATSLNGQDLPSNASLEKNAERLSAEDSIQVVEHSIKKATWRSVMLPGWGQLYNKKYLKAPIIWAGMGTTIGFAIYNHQQYLGYRDAYNIRIDDDPETTDEYVDLYTGAQLITLENTFRRWRDLSIILTIGVYAYNILDAYVDAHLFYFDISDDLSMKIHPSMQNNTAFLGSNLVPSMRVSFDF